MEIVIHGTCVALGSVCAILRGPCGSGKSDVALRFLFLPVECLTARPALVADDQVMIRRTGKGLKASCPPALASKIEVRGVGIVRMPHIIREAELRLLVDLDGLREVPRLPDFRERETVLDLPVHRIELDPFESSAPIKIALILRNFFEEIVD